MMKIASNRLHQESMYSYFQMMSLFRRLFISSMLACNLLIFRFQLISSYKKVCSVPAQKVVITNITKAWNFDSIRIIGYLKKFIILVFESESMSVVVSRACCMWCNHLSAACWVTGNGLWRAIRAGWPAIKACVLAKGKLWRLQQP